MTGPRIALTKDQVETGAGAELLSLCQTVTADGSLSDDEVAALNEWLRQNASANLPSIAFLVPVVESIVADGVVTPQERRQLFQAIERVLPPEVRGMSRAARMAREQIEKEQRKSEASAARAAERAERERNGPIERFDFMVAGAKFEGRDKVIAREVRSGDVVVLQRDAANRYSRNAVAVLTQSGRQIGFVPEDDAEDLAPLLDAGNRYAARVKKILQGSSHQIPVIVVEIYGPDADADALVAEVAEQEPEPVGAASIWKHAMLLLLLILVLGALIGR